MPRRTPSSSEALLSKWQRRPEFGKPIGVVATTFTFHGGFFEEECLGRFVGMQSSSNDDPRGYLLEREEKLSECRAFVLVDRQHVTAMRSLRWDQLAVAVPRGGILHAKLTLLAWEKRVRLLVSSANLTKPGYRRNLELLAVFDFGPEEEIESADQLPLALLHDAVEFVRKIVTYLPVLSLDADSGPVSRLGRFLKRVINLTARWPDGKWGPREPRAVWLPVLPKGPSLFETIAERAWAGPGPSAVQILSPFYECDDRALRVLSGLEKVMAQRGQDRKVTFQAPGLELPGGAIDLQLPEIYKHPAFPRLTHRFQMNVGIDEAGEPRPLHAKGLILQRDKEDPALVVMGSSNFTLAGTGVGETCNIELNVGFVVSPGNENFLQACQHERLSLVDVNLDEHDVRFVATGELLTPDPEDACPLPERFGEAVFSVSESLLRLQVFEGEPARFEVMNPGGQHLVDWDGHAAPEGGELGVPLAADDPTARDFSHLVVLWTGPDGGPRRAIWVVNVLDPAALRPPEELRELTLNELLQVLGSSRPIHEAIQAATSRRARAGTTNVASELDPHKRVDTSGYLLRRVRAVSVALEGLRERLEAPAHSLESIDWRLNGPVGPLVLARRLHGSEGAAAGFLIAETALTVANVRWSEAERRLGREAVRQRVRGVVAQLAALARTCQAPEGGLATTSLRDYVESTLIEAGA